MVFGAGGVNVDMDGQLACVVVLVRSRGLLLANAQIQRLVL